MVEIVRFANSLVFKWHFGFCGPKPFENWTFLSGFRMVMTLRNPDVQSVRYLDESGIRVSGIRVSGFRMVTV